jgi:DNA-binding CsgD family transcriptional regulator
VSRQAACDHTFAALAQACESILAEVTAHGSPDADSPDPDSPRPDLSCPDLSCADLPASGSPGPGSPHPDYCPLCGNLLSDTGLQARDILLRATLPEHIAAALMRTPSLSPREQAVFELLGLGYDNRSLARVLDVSERTAKRHVTAILTKLGLESRLQAGLVALLTTSLRLS